MTTPPQNATNTAQAASGAADRPAAEVAAAAADSAELAATVAARNARLEHVPLRPTGTRGGFITGFGLSVAEIWQRRELLGLLVRRELKARYKDSALGMVWGLIRPLTQLLVYYLVLGQFLRAAEGIPEFAIFIFSGLALYGLAAELVTTLTGSIVGNSGLVKKVYLPREIFPLAAVGSAGFNFLLQLVILLAASLIAGTLLLGWHLLYAVAAIVLVLIYGLTFGLALSALNVYFRDVQYLVEVIVLLMMWASPIVYAWSYVGNALGVLGLPPWIAEAYLYNPLTLGVLGFQAAFWAPGLEQPFAFPEHLGLRILIASGIGLVLLFLAQRLFSRLQGDFAQEL